MAQSEALKVQLKKSAEVLTETALSEVVKLAEVYAADSESTVDDSIVDGVKMLKKAFLDDLVDKISDQDGD